MPSVYTFDCTLYATVNVVAGSRWEAERHLAEWLTDACLDLVVAEGNPDADDNGRVILVDADLSGDEQEAPRLRAVVTGGPNNL
jgi:hypothetical protein